MTNTSPWRVCFVSQESELWLQIARWLRVNGLIPHHKRPCSCSWGCFLPDIYQSVNLLFSFPLHHPILLEKGLISESAFGLSVWYAKWKLNVVAWFYLEGRLECFPCSRSLPDLMTKRQKTWYWLMVNGMDLLVKMAQFCFMDDLCNVLMCCLYNVKTNLHNSTASEAGLFF